MYYDIGLRPVLPVVVHPRVAERYPEIEPQDVEAAWVRSYESVRRPDENVWIVLGFDRRGRRLEVIGRVQGGAWLLFHAFTPPTKKILRETEQIRRRTR